MHPTLPIVGSMLGSILLALAACGSPPIPPTVDPSTRRPVNSAMAVELQVCQGDLQSSRMRATESGRRAESNAVLLDRLAVRQPGLAAMQAGQAANRVYTLRFGPGSTRVAVAPELAEALLADARVAPLVLLRGRTDGTSDNLIESRVARERAEAVRDYLVGAGIDPGRIRATYQPVGDPVADNSSRFGRGLNRRVEIELYRVLPVAAETPARPSSVLP